MISHQHVSRRLALVLLTCLIASTAALSLDQKPMRLLVVGDSMTHQREGDFTWRYRLWQWFQQENIAVQFVGPYHGTSLDHEALQHNPGLERRVYWDEGMNWKGGYAPFTEPEFVTNNSYHFAAAGRPMLWAKDWVEQVLKLYPADLMLVMLGINDLAFCCDADLVVELGLELITNARKVNPDLKIAFADAPLQMFKLETIPKTIDYNRYLRGNITGWSTSKSPVGLVKLSEHYGCGSCECPGGHDGLHPNSWGDYHIAYAFSETLIKDFGMGSCPVEIADREASLVRFLPAPNELRVLKHKNEVVATWGGVYGAYQYRIEVTKNGAQPVIYDLNYNYWSEPLASPAPKYSIRVAAVAQQQVGLYSEPETDVEGDTSGILAPPALRRDIPLTNKRRALTSRDAVAECVGGTAPKQQTCDSWKREHPHFTSNQLFQGSNHLIAALLLLVFVVGVSWVGYRALTSKTERKYTRLDDWRRLGSSWVHDEE